MSELVTVARPYARAAFEVAQERRELEVWSGFLTALAAMISSPEISEVIRNPRISSARIAEFVIGLFEGSLAVPCANLIRQLSGARRLALAPSIRDLFEALRADAERRVTVEIISAQALDAGQEDRLAAILQRRIGKRVNIKSSVDRSLLGGAVLRVGDRVMDGTLKSRLAKLCAKLVR